MALYVGRDDRTPLERVLLGNTAAGAASRATRPVVVVPADWAPEFDTHGVVVVAVKNPAHSTELSADAFALAAVRGARLVVLHAWTLPSGYEKIVADRVATEELAARSVAELEKLVRHVHRFPGSLGGTGRAVLRGARCPVRVIAPGAVSALAGLVLEQDGGIYK